jgi:hypothetical protein
MEWPPVYHVKGWGKFNRYYGDFCTGADTQGPLVPPRVPSAPYRGHAHPAIPYPAAQCPPSLLKMSHGFAHE